MNDQKIYQYLARKPDARAQDVADALGAELKDTSEALRDLVEVGTVVRHAGTGRNGLPSQLYNLSDVFKRSRDGVALLAAAAAEVPAPAAAPLVDTPVFAKQTELQPAKTRVERGLDHLKLHKTATDDEMRSAMGLRGIDAPRAYMVSAIKSGKVVKDEKGWRLGDGTPIEKQKPGAASRKYNEPKPKVGPVAQFGKNEQPVDPAPNVQEQLGRIAVGLPPKDETPPPAAPAPTLPVFRCGLWSDGVLELQRNGVEVARLTRGEGEHLAEFMGRMLGQAEQVAA